MQARKVDLRDYDVTLPDERVVPYHVRNSLCEILMNPGLKLNGPDLLKRNAVGQKILDATDSVLLEGGEWNLLVSGVEACQGLGRNDVELVKRIMEAEVVEVDEAV